VAAFFSNPRGDLRLMREIVELLGAIKKHKREVRPATRALRRCAPPGVERAAPSAPALTLPRAGAPRRAAE
jgi:hypothetical protein